jgi:hypothetical protein
MERVGRQEDFDNQRRGPIVFQITCSPPPDIIFVVVCFIQFNVEPSIHSFDLCVGFRVGRGEVNSRVQDDKSGLCMEILHNLVEALHLSGRVVCRLLLSAVGDAVSVTKVF